MSEQDDRLDQRLLAQLWRLENDGEADRRVALRDDQYLSLFLDADNGRSYILRHAAAEANEEVEVGRESEAYEFESRRNAEAAFDDLVREAASEDRVVDADSMEDLGDPATEGPTTTETGRENLRDW